MVDIDQAMAAIKPQATAEPSEPAPAEDKGATPKQETATASENKDLSGSAEPKKGAPETPDQEQQNDRLPKSNVAFQKLKHELGRKIKSRDEAVAKLTDALSQFTGLKFDKDSGDIESYVKAVMQKRDLEASKASLEDDSEIEGMREQLRDFQAQEVYGHDDKAMKLYNEQIKPKRKVLYEELKKLDPTGAVLQYMGSSKRAALLEVAFICKGGQQVFEDNVTDDPYTTKRNLERLENEMFNALDASRQKKQTQPAAVTTPSVNDGAQVTQTKTGPSLADVAKWY